MRVKQLQPQLQHPARNTPRGQTPLIRDIGPISGEKLPTEPTRRGTVCPSPHHSWESHHGTTHTVTTCDKTRPELGPLQLQQVTHPHRADIVTRYYQSPYAWSDWVQVNPLAAPCPAPGCKRRCCWAYWQPAPGHILLHTLLYVLLIRWTTVSAHTFGRTVRSPPFWSAPLLPHLRRAP